MQELIDRLKKHRNEFMWFSQPVDWKKMGLTDYPKIVQKPMDFSTLEGKVVNAYTCILFIYRLVDSGLVY